jgi:DNA end-binding protein Ku
MKSYSHASFSPDLIRAIQQALDVVAAADCPPSQPTSAAAGQKEMLLPISGKRAAKQDAKKADKPAAARTRKRA